MCLALDSFYLHHLKSDFLGFMAVLRKSRVIINSARTAIDSNHVTHVYRGRRVKKVGLPDSLRPSGNISFNWYVSSGRESRVSDHGCVS